MWLLLFIFGSSVGQEVNPNGERIFAQSCSVGYCHGVAGSAGRGPRLRGRKLERSYVEKVTRDGIPDSAMPGWKGRLSDQEIAAVVDYIMGLASASDLVPPSNPMPPGEGPATLAEFAGPPAARRGQDLFFDATRTPRCGSCHAARRPGSCNRSRLVDPGGRESAGFHRRRAQQISEARADCPAKRRRYLSGVESRDRRMNSYSCTILRPSCPCCARSRDRKFGLSPREATGGTRRSRAITVMRNSPRSSHSFNGCSPRRSKQIPPRHEDTKKHQESRRDKNETRIRNCLDLFHHRGPDGA